MHNIPQLQDSIESMIGYKSKYLETVAVVESFDGHTVWEGNVEVFEIMGHPVAKRCYAWTHKTGENKEKIRTVVVLEIPPINSPQTAVRSTI